jgi:hypothetical protein
MNRFQSSASVLALAAVAFLIGEATNQRAYGSDNETLENHNQVHNQIVNNIKAEEKRLEDDLNGFNIYPVLSLGLSYQF